MHLVVFVIRIFTMHGHMNVKFIRYSLIQTHLIEDTNRTVHLVQCDFLN